MCKNSSYLASRVACIEDAGYELAGSFDQHGIVGFHQPCDWIGVKNNCNSIIFPEK